MDPVCNHWMSLGGWPSWMGYDPFEVMEIPVKAYEWVPTQFTQNGNNLYMTTGHWETTPLGNALGYFGGAAPAPQFSWWGTRIKSFFTNFSLKGARLPGETFSQCMGRTQDALLTRGGAVTLAGVSGVGLLAVPGTISVGTVRKAVRVGEAGKALLYEIRNVPAPPILDVAPWVSKSVGITTAVAWGLEGGFALACRSWP